MLAAEPKKALQSEYGELVTRFEFQKALNGLAEVLVLICSFQRSR